MRRCLCCLLLLLGLVSPTALALDEESAAQATQAQSEAFGFDDLERIGEAYTGQEDIAGGVDAPGAFRHVGQTAKDNLGQVVRTAVRSCVLLQAVPLLWGLAQGMQAAGAKLRGHGGIRYIYYQGEVKQLVESTHTEVRDERSFTLLEDVNCPAVLAEQCFVTSEEDVAQFGSEEGCKTVARVYYEAICAYFGTQPLDTPL